MLFGIICVIGGIVYVILGAFTDIHYEWLTTKWQQQFIGKTASRIMGVISGIILIVAGIAFIVQQA